MPDRGKTAPALAAFWLRGPAAWGFAGLAAAFLIVGLPAATYTLNHFYRDGAVIDSWYLAWLVWRNDLSLSVPNLLGEGRSFFGTHLSPILLLPTLISHFVPLGMIAWFSAVIGALHGSVSAAIYDTVRRGLRLHTRAGTVGAVAIAAGYGLGGLAMAALMLPHFEILIVGFGILFLAALSRGARGWAWLWLALALSVREDAGFHLTAVLIVAQAIRRRRDAWPFLAAALIAGVASFAIKRTFWPDAGLMSSVFMGDPPYAHLTWALVVERFWVIVGGRGYVWQTALVTILWALWRRDLLVAAGLAASVPWIVLSVTAVSNAPGTLDQYYSFPLLLAAAWPLIAPSWRSGAAVADAPRRQTLAWAAIMAVAMFAGWRGELVFYPRVMNLTLRTTPAEAQRVEEFGVRLKEGVRELGLVRADAATMSLWPDAGHSLQWLQEPARVPDSLRGNDTVIWFEPGLHDSLAWAAWLSSRLPNQFRVIGTNIVMATNRRLDQLPTFAPLLVATNIVSRRMRPTAIAQYVPDGLRVAIDAPRGLIAQGPHSWMRYGLDYHHGVALPPGHYQGQFEFRLVRVKDRATAVLRVEVGFFNARIVAAKDVRLQDLPATNPDGLQSFVVTLPFEVTPDLERHFLELRAIHVGNAELVLRRVDVVRPFDE